MSSFDKKPTVVSVCAILARIRDPKKRQKIIVELSQKPSNHWKNIMIGSTQFEKFKGKYLTEIAQILQRNEVETLLYLIDADELKTGGIFFSLSKKNLWKVLAFLKSAFFFKSAFIFSSTAIIIL